MHMTCQVRGCMGVSQHFEKKCISQVPSSIHPTHSQRWVKMQWRPSVHLPRPPPWQMRSGGSYRKSWSRSGDRSGIRWVMVQRVFILLIQYARSTLVAVFATAVTSYMYNVWFYFQTRPGCLYILVLFAFQTKTCSFQVPRWTPCLLLSILSNISSCSFDMIVQPSRQNKCWQWMFPQITWMKPFPFCMLLLFVPFRLSFLFHFMTMLYLWYMHKNCKARVR